MFKRKGIPTNESTFGQKRNSQPPICQISDLVRENILRGDIDHFLRGSCISDGLMVRMKKYIKLGDNKIIFTDMNQTITFKTLTNKELDEDKLDEEELDYLKRVENRVLLFKILFLSCYMYNLTIHNQLFKLILKNKITIPEGDRELTKMAIWMIFQETDGFLYAFLNKTMTEIYTANQHKETDSTWLVHIRSEIDNVYTPLDNITTEMVTNLTKQLKITTSPNDYEKNHLSFNNMQRIMTSEIYDKSLKKTNQFFEYPHLNLRNLCTFEWIKTIKDINYFSGALRGPGYKSFINTFNFESLNTAVKIQMGVIAAKSFNFTLYEAIKKNVGTDADSTLSAIFDTLTDTELYKRIKVPKENQKDTDDNDVSGDIYTRRPAYDPKRSTPY